MELDSTNHFMETKREMVGSEAIQRILIPIGHKESLMNTALITSSYASKIDFVASINQKISISYKDGDGQSHSCKTLKEVQVPDYQSKLTEIATDQINQGQSLKHHPLYTHVSKIVDKIKGEFMSISFQFNFQKKEVTGSTFFNGVIEFLPETKSIKKYVSKFFYNLHDDSKLEDFAQFFKKFDLENPNAIFFLYTRVVTRFIRDQKEFQEKERDFNNKAFQTMGVCVQSDTIKKMIEENVQASYRGFPTLAIAKALGKSVQEIDLAHCKEEDVKDVSVLLEDRISALFRDRITAVSY